MLAKPDSYRQSYLDSVEPSTAGQFFQADTKEKFPIFKFCGNHIVLTLAMPDQLDIKSFRHDIFGTLFWAQYSESCIQNPEDCLMIGNFLFHIQYQ